MLAVKVNGMRGDFHLDVDIELESGVTGLVGPSGSGKTSLLRAIAGLWKAEEGRISDGERILFDRSIFMPVQERKIAAIWQRPLLFPHMSVLKNIRYGFSPSNEVEGEAELSQLITLLDLDSLLHRMPGNLSGGEAQRVAFARALASNPRIVLMDEPLTGLDEARRNRVLEYLQRLFEKIKIPVLYVSHYRDELDRIADRVLTMQDGQIVMDSDQTRNLGSEMDGA